MEHCINYLFSAVFILVWMLWCILWHMGYLYIYSYLFLNIFDRDVLNVRAGLTVFSPYLTTLQSFSVLQTSLLPVDGDRDLICLLWIHRAQREFMLASDLCCFYWLDSIMFFFFFRWLKRVIDCDQPTRAHRLYSICSWSGPLHFKQVQCRVCVGLVTKKNPKCCFSVYNNNFLTRKINV